MSGGLDQMLAFAKIDFREPRWPPEPRHRRRPRVLSTGFTNSLGAPFLNFNFDLPGIVDSTAQASDLMLTNLATNQPVSTAGFTVTYDIINRNLKFLPPANLPDGNYHANLGATTVADAFGNAMQTDASLDFFILAGDANRDRQIDTLDFDALAARFNQTGVGNSGGGFHYQGIRHPPGLNLL